MTDQDTVCLVMTFLPFKIIQNTCQLVCKDWYAAIHSSYFWRVKLKIEFPSVYAQLEERHQSSYFDFSRRQFFTVYYDNMCWKYQTPRRLKFKRCEARMIMNKRSKCLQTSTSGSAERTLFQPEFQSQLAVAGRKCWLTGYDGQSRVKYFPVSAVIEGNEVYLYAFSRDQILHPVTQISKSTLRINVSLNSNPNLGSVHFVHTGKNLADMYLMITDDDTIYLVHLNNAEIKPYLHIFQIESTLKIKCNILFSKLHSITMIQKSARDSSKMFHALVVLCDSIILLEIDPDYLSARPCSILPLTNGIDIIRVSKPHSAGEKLSIFCLNKTGKLEHYNIVNRKINAPRKTNHGLSCVNIVALNSHWFLAVKSDNAIFGYRIDVMDIAGTVLASNLYFGKKVVFSHYAFYDPWLVVLASKGSGNYTCYVFEVNRALYEKTLKLGISTKPSNIEDDVVLAHKKFQIPLGDTCKIQSILIDQVKLVLLCINTITHADVVLIYNMKSGKHKQTVENNSERVLIEILGLVGPSSLLAISGSNKFNLFNYDSL